MTQSTREALLAAERDDWKRRAEAAEKVANEARDARDKYGWIPTGSTLDAALAEYDAALVGKE